MKGQDSRQRESKHIEIEELFLYEEGTLETGRSESLTAHLEGCGICRTELSLLRKYKSVPANAEVEGRSDSLSAEFHARLEERRAREEGVAQERFRVVEAGARPHRGMKPPGRWVAIGMIAASALLVAIGVFQMIPDREVGDLGTGYRSSPVTNLVDVRVEPGQAGDDREDGTWTIAWTLPAGAHHPELEILNSFGEVVRERDLIGSELALSRQDIPGAERFALLFVRVTAIDAAGEVIKSEPVRLD